MKMIAGAIVALAASLSLVLAGSVHTLTMSASPTNTVLPKRDGVRDSVYIEFTAGDDGEDCMARSAFRIRNARTGEVVFRYAETHDGCTLGSGFRFFGRYGGIQGSGRPVPYGEYIARAVVTYRDGETMTVRRSVFVKAG